MKFDLGEVLRRTWYIGWNHKVLWLIQLVPAVMSMLIFPLLILANPAFAPLLPRPWNQTLSEPRQFTTLLAIVSFMMAVAFILVWTFVYSATMLGALEVEGGARRLDLRGLLQRAWPFYWGVLGLYLLFLGAWALVLLLVWGAMLASWTYTRGIGLICLSPLLLLLFPLGLIGFALFQLAQAAILAEDLSIQEALSRAWQLFRDNALGVLVFMFLIYILASFIGTLVTGPMMVPMVLMPAVATSSSGTVHPVLPFVFLVFFPLLMLLALAVQGIIMAFFQAAWAVLYTRLALRPVQAGRASLSTSLEGSS